MHFNHLLGNTNQVTSTSRTPTPKRTNRGVKIEPFRGWRIAPAYIEALAAQYATPWLQNGDHTHLTHIFNKWQSDGAIDQDMIPAIYVYEQTGPHGTLHGILASTHLDSELLPHENVIPERVNALTNLMRNTRINLDPVLLGFTGDGRTAACITRTTHERPVLEVHCRDGQSHRLWRISDAVDQSDVIDELSGRAAYIADGHHRYAAGLRLRSSMHAENRGPGPWDYLPALFVDADHSPLILKAIHRVVPFADPRQVLDAARTQFQVREIEGEITEWLTLLELAASKGPAFILVTPKNSYLVSDPATELLETVLRGTPESVKNVHLTVLHSVLLEHLWQVPDHPDDIHYEHNSHEAVRRVREEGGVAILTTPPTQQELAAAAMDRVCLPRKSTSFGPKPHPGLIFRAFEDVSLSASDPAIAFADTTSKKG